MLLVWLTVKWLRYSYICFSSCRKERKKEKHLHCDDLFIYVGYLLSGFEYFYGRFAQPLNQGRTQRALSNALITFPKRPSLRGENPRKLLKKIFKNSKILVKSRTIRLGAIARKPRPTSVIPCSIDLFDFAHIFTVDRPNKVRNIPKISAHLNESFRRYRH